MITLCPCFRPKFFSKKLSPRIRDRCYDRNFWRFLTIFGEKIGVFLENQCYDQILAKASSSLGNKPQYFRQIFRREFFKNHNIGPCFDAIFNIMYCG
jgi:hypothetical protein